MKTLFIFSILTYSFAFGQDSEATGLAGDNLDLYAVLDLFENSKSLEDFEEELNKEKNGINNLDLNNDGSVDYIMVIDYQDSLNHAITLRVPVSENELQDVAVIEIEETGEEITQLQIIGDEELYGENYIIEPKGAADGDIVNVYRWRPIRHIYGPRYVVWVSPWRWGHYPHWHRPWKPVGWSVYHKRHYKLHGHYRRAHVRRCVHAHTHYKKHHSHSNWFHENHHKNTSINSEGGGKIKQTGNPKVVKDKGGHVSGGSTQKSKKPARRGSTGTQTNQTKRERRQHKRPGGTIKNNSSNRTKSQPSKRGGRR